MQYSRFEDQLAKKIAEICQAHPDPSHDFLHVQRVVANAKHLAQHEGANLDVVIPAAYLHDFVMIAKNDPRRSQASRLSAEAAVQYLRELHYPEEHLQAIGHAIAAHSFSAAIAAETIEAKVVQDADRLDGLGAIGVARCFAMSGLLQRPFYHSQDPFCDQRQANDHANTLDHFYVKLLKVPALLQTSSGRREGEKRLRFLETFLSQLKEELC